MKDECVLTASSLEGNDVKNGQGENLGSIKDIVLCVRDNKIEYYVLSFGGVLGLGDKLFAIPPESMELSNGEDECFVLNIDKEKLKNAEGFDKDNWPNFADPAFKKSVYNQYGYGDRLAA